MKIPFFGKKDAAAEEHLETVVAAPGSPEPGVPETGRSGRRWLGFVLPLLTLAAVIATIFVFVRAAQLAEADGRIAEVIEAQKVLSQTVSKEASESVGGSEAAFDALERAADRFDQTLLTLANGDELVPVEPLPSDLTLTNSLGQVAELWQPARNAIDRMLAERPAVLSGQFAAGEFTAKKAELANSIEAFTEALASGYTPLAQVAAAGQLGVLAERLSDNAQRALGGGPDAARAGESFASDASQLARLIEAFASGNSELGIAPVEDDASKAALKSLSKTYSGATALVQEIDRFGVRTRRANEAAVQVNAQADALLDASQTLQGQFEAFVATRPVSNQLGLGLAGLTAFIALLLVAQQAMAGTPQTPRDTRDPAAEARMLEEQAREINRQNQEAILRLLDEISDLADGDLTINATVTEDVTGAIADAINYAIDALRDTVTNINSVSVEVAGEARMTRDTAVQLTDSASRQAEQIESAAQSIEQLANAARTVSANAERSRQVAEQSVQFAAAGNEAVRATIDGMDNIRETIQETSKRIKRLGESSQEIGEIVGLIDDIADQTNILALNAAIQASMAGEQGRGFAVVADEVQRLAERASQATKQIEALVKAIQSDTNEAVNSMEQSTAGVVQGAELAEDAGQALVRIEVVSKELAELTDAISLSSSGQTDQVDAANVSMNEISRITAETTSGTQQTANSIGRLATLATDLRTSVAGFRLPDGAIASAGTLVTGYAGDESETVIAAPGELPHSAAQGG
ncbi:MAG: methyl-accepting chemotaxis protein [Pseudomonadota bacterium]